MDMLWGIIVLRLIEMGRPFVWYHSLGWDAALYEEEKVG